MTPDRARELTKKYEFDMSGSGRFVLHKSDVVKLLCEWGKDDVLGEDKKELDFISAHAKHLDDEDVLSEVKKWIEEEQEKTTYEEVVIILGELRDKITELEGKV
jgi:hypothetical protein